MNVKIHYRITQDRAGLPSDYTGARHAIATGKHGDTKHRLIALHELLDRGWGKAVQPTELTGAEGGPLIIQWQD